MQYLYSMIMVSSVHIGTLVSQFWPRQAVELFSLAHHARSTVATSLKDHQTRPLRMHINVFAGLKQVWIIKVPDKRGPDNRSCTVSTSVHTRHYTALLLTQGTRLGIPHCY